MHGTNVKTCFNNYLPFLKTQKGELGFEFPPCPQIKLSTQGDVLMDSATPEIETMGEAEQTEPLS